MTIALSFVLFLVTSIHPFAPVLDSLPIAEDNIYYDEYGKRVFEQIIFYRYYSDMSAYHVADYRMSDKGTILIFFSRSLNQYVYLIYVEGLLREIRVNSRFISWTQYDPEVWDRNFLPMSDRKKLRKSNNNVVGGGVGNPL